MAAPLTLLLDEPRKLTTRPANGFRDVVEVDAQRVNNLHKIHPVGGHSVSVVVHGSSTPVYVR